MGAKNKPATSPKQIRRNQKKKTHGRRASFLFFFKGGGVQRGSGASPGALKEAQKLAFQKRSRGPFSELSPKAVSSCGGRIETRVGCLRCLFTGC